MANHGFVNLKRPINREQLGRLLDQVNQARFKGRLKITHDPKGWDGKPTFEIELWSNEHSKNQGSLSCLFWLARPRKIEHRHGPGGHFRWWVENIFSNDLAVRLGGKESDEGCGGRWRGKAGRWPTLRDYVLGTWVCPNPALSKDDQEMRRLMAAGDADDTIKAMRGIRPDLAEFLGELSDPPVKVKFAFDKKGNMVVSAKEGKK